MLIDYNPTSRRGVTSYLLYIIGIVENIFLLFFGVEQSNHFEVWPLHHTHSTLAKKVWILNSEKQNNIMMDSYQINNDNGFPWWWYTPWASSLLQATTVQRFYFSSIFLIIYHENCISLIILIPELIIVWYGDIVSMLYSLPLDLSLPIMSSKRLF